MFSFLRFIFSLEFLLKIRVWWSLSYTIFHLEGKSQWYVYFFHRIQIPLQMSFRYINFGHTVYILSGLNWSQLNLISNSIIFLLLWIFHENYILSNYFETKSLNHCSWNKIFFSPWRSYYDFVNLETSYGICFRGLYPPKFLGKNEFWYFYIFWHFNLCWVSPWN